MAVTEPCDLMEVLTRLDYHHPDLPYDANRGYRRFSVRGDATIESAEVDEETVSLQNVLLRDISRGGVGFLCEKFLTPGSVWRISFKVHGHRVSTQPIVIRYCRMVQDGLYLVGSQFTIEAFVIHSLGVSMHDLANDIIGQAAPQDIAVLGLAEREAIEIEE